ncbi:MAG: tRNA (adenosine(37)-N6)-threonylcarbamoyltransferase complex dimerization subunit type 1 TsaB [Firmicutes bacterium]|nr:tRNA (adenosine(37)-N6)-threonylcarbamoyltransferase complex dimerization subunit type 1 TsaB [Bacillota bacterium]
MLLLAFDTTTRVCTVALGDGDNIRAEYMLHIKRTHSRHLLPLIVSLLKDSGVDKDRLDGVVVSVGPGSFTGIRVGMATAKGLCLGLKIPVVGVMTLDALAGACAVFPGLICPILDARRDQVYTALYRGGTADPQMLQPAAALSCGKLVKMLGDYEEEVIFLGDAVKGFGKELKLQLGEKRYKQAPLPSCFNRASLVLQRGVRIWREEGPLSPHALKPFYIRLPEAERKLQEKNRKEKSKIAGKDHPHDDR